MSVMASTPASATTGTTTSGNPIPRNYSDLMLTSGKSRKMTFQLHFFEESFKQLHNNMFVRVGRSLIVNKQYIYVINLTDQMLLFAGQQIKGDIAHVRVSRDALKQLKQQLEEEK